MSRLESHPIIQKFQLNKQPLLVLAPMEGITNFPMREFLTEVGAYDFCVTDFLRVSDLVPPEKVIEKHIPEIKNNCKTKNGTPVVLQILGGSAEVVSQTALKAASLGVNSIDINFGCPSPTVNRHQGGAVLLKNPSQITAILQATRALLPLKVSLSAKVRLGWDTFVIQEIAEAVGKGGVDWLTIHGRTRMQAYTKPAYWNPISEVAQAYPHIPVIANGEIWNESQFIECLKVTKAKGIMLARGAIANPLLSRKLVSGFTKNPLGQELEQIFWHSLLGEYHGRYELTPKRAKQWLRMAKDGNMFNQFDSIKVLDSVDEILQKLKLISETEPRAQSALTPF